MAGLLDSLFQGPDQGGNFNWQQGLLALAPALAASAFDPYNRGRYLMQGGSNFLQGMQQAHQFAQENQYRQQDLAMRQKTNELQNQNITQEMAQRQAQQDATQAQRHLLTGDNTGFNYGTEGTSTEPAQVNISPRVGRGLLDPTYQLGADNVPQQVGGFSGPTAALLKGMAVSDPTGTAQEAARLSMPQPFTGKPGDVYGTRDPLTQQPTILGSVAPLPETAIGKALLDRKNNLISDADVSAAKNKELGLLSPEAMAQQLQIAGTKAQQSYDIKNPTITGPAPGTIGKPAIDTAPEGYERNIVPNTGGLTQSAIDQGAIELATTGNMPGGMGIGSTGNGALKKNAIQNRAGELNSGGNMAANKTQLKALGSSLAQQTKLADTTERSIGNAERGFNQVVTAFKGKINNSRLPIVNAITNAALYQLSPGDLSAMRGGLTEVANEYATVFSRGGTMTDAVRDSAKRIADGNLSMDDLGKVFQEMQAQGGIVVQGARNQVGKIQGQLNGLLGGGAAPAQGAQQQLPDPLGLR